MRSEGTEKLYSVRYKNMKAWYKVEWYLSGNHIYTDIKDTNIKCMPNLPFSPRS